MLCNVTTGTKQERMENMEKVFNYWNSKRNILDRFGGKHDWDGRSSAENMQWLIEARLEVPWDADSPLTEAHLEESRWKLMLLTMLLVESSRI